MIRLTLTNEQAKVVAGACYLYGNIRRGLFLEILRTTFRGTESGHGSNRQAEARRHLMAARDQIFPELANTEGGFPDGKFPAADLALEIRNVIAGAISTTNAEQSGRYPLLKCENITPEKKQRKTETGKKKPVSVCAYNDGVECPKKGRNCEKCGWRNG